MKDYIQRQAKKNEIEVSTKTVVWILRHHQLMSIDEAGLCYRFSLHIHHWVPSFVGLNPPRKRLNKRP